MLEDSDLNHEDVEFEPAAEDLPAEEVVEEVEQDDEEAGGEKGQAKQDKSYVDLSALPEDVRKPYEKRLAELYRRSMSAEKLEQKVAELEAKLTQQPIKEVAPPNVDLAIDNPAEFVKRNQEYLDYLKEVDRDNERKRGESQRVQALQQQELAQRVSSFNERASQRKIDRSIIQQSAQMLEDTGVAHKIGDLLLDDEQGPEMMAYLHKNIEAVYQLAQLDDKRAVQYLERNIRPRLAQTKKPSAPPPPTKISGNRGTGKIADDKHGFTVG